MTGSGTRVTESGYAGPRDGQWIASANVATASGGSESALVGHGSSQKTATGSDETAHEQKESVTSHGESAYARETANGPWSESGTPKTSHEPLETESRHGDPLPEKLDPEGEISGKSESGSGLR